MEFLVLVVVAALQAVAVQSIRNDRNTPFIVTDPDGFLIYPCLQVDHREPELNDSVMGQWYVIEKVQHMFSHWDQKGYQMLEDCPQLTLYRESTSIVRLMWHEKAGDIIYKFKMPDPENSGFWITRGRQNGSLLTKGYEQFAGSVQVIEAQPLEMILTFCVNQQKHYSIILVRNITSAQRYYNFRETLSIYGLPMGAVQYMCIDANAIAASASKSIPPMVLLMSSLLLFKSGQH